MFSPSNRRQRFSLFSAVNRRWLRSRPGSVLILVIALLVLLALIGTAYLSSTQTERYTSVQNTINTEADLLENGLILNVEGRITNELYGSNGQFRPTSQEMFQPTQTLTSSGYNAFTSPATEDFLSERIPTYSTALSTPVWDSTSWVPFPDSSGFYTVDSPFDTSLPLTNSANKVNIVNIPYYRTINGKVYPAMYYYVPPSLAGINIPTTNGGTYAVTSAGGYLTVSSAGAISVSLLPPTPMVCASATGEGVADAGLFKIPIGPIDGITYYGSIRVVDANSAVNVSTAWSAAVDPPLTAPLSDGSLTEPTAKTTNYGFFRSNIGLRELLNASNTSEMDYLNYYRFNNVPMAAPSPSNTMPGTAAPSINTTPVDDTGNPATFSWYSTDGTTFLAGDALDTQLARRTLYPGVNTSTGTPAVLQKYVYLNKSQSAPLASRFSLVNNSVTPSLIEQFFPYETVYNKVSGKLFPTAPYSPLQIYTTATSSTGYWWNDLYNFSFPTAAAPNTSVPLRTLFTASNPISNGIPSRYGNTTTGGVAYSATATYNFGDWVTYPDPVTKLVHSFVCVQPIITAASGAPPLSPATSSQYWTLVPWSYQPVKASINTATFEQLWLNFCHVMTDTIPTNPVTGDVTGTATVPQWQPPLMLTSTPGNSYYGEEQMPQFRSVIRDNRLPPMSNATNTGQPFTGGSAPTLSQSPTFVSRVQMTPMQMMQLRAAIAAINTVSIRNINADISTPLTSKHMTRSRRVILPDTMGNPAFEAEVFGNDIQPYISQMYAQVNDPGDGPSNFIAIQLINPDTTTDITMGPTWVFATIDRLAANSSPGNPNLSVTSQANGNASLKILKASMVGGVLTPGMLTIYDGTIPGGFNLPTGAMPVSGLAQGIGKELIILRPRRLDGTLSTSPGYAIPSAPQPAAAYFDRFDETTHIYDLLPVDQLDMSGLNNAPAATNNIYYRRGADQTPSATPGGPTFAWNFTWPGFYTPYNSYNTTAPGPGQTGKQPPQYTPTSAPIATYPFNQAFVATATAPTAANPDFNKLCSGSPDITGASPIAPTYNTITLQLVNTSLPGINPVGTLPKNCFPFGGFARNADMLQIPFIGAYRIIDYHRQMDDVTNNSSQQFYEMNSVTMDASLANDSTLQSSAANPTPTLPSKILPSTALNSTANPPILADTVSDPFVEQIGHFCPIGDTSPSTYSFGVTPDPTKELDFGTALSPTNPSQYWHYHWAKRLFDYFTVQAPHDDYFPNADPDLSYTNYADQQKLSAPLPTAITNNIGDTANVGEDLVGVDGLININTAPWPVLATLPFVPRTTILAAAPKTDYLKYDTFTGKSTIATAGMANGTDDNIDLAKAIVDYRNANGPFKSIMDLYNVPAFRLENDALLSVAEPSVAQGDFSPSGINPTATPIPTDGARFDFEERYLLLNQISNLITTRSDTFTCYIDLQGWRNVGTGNPTLAVERRKSFIFDRNTFAPTFKNPVYFQVAGN